MTWVLSWLFGRLPAITSFLVPCLLTVTRNFPRPHLWRDTSYDVTLEWLVISWSLDSALVVACDGFLSCVLPLLWMLAPTLDPLDTPLLLLAHAHLQCSISSLLGTCRSSFLTSSLPSFLSHTQRNQLPLWNQEPRFI